MDMWRPFEQAVRQALRGAAIVFDRFHVMQQYSKVIDLVRRAEFNRASKEDKNALIGSRYSLLKNAEHLTEQQQARLDELQAANTHPNPVYTSKNGSSSSDTRPAPRVAVVTQRLDAWCELADATELSPI